MIPGSTEGKYFSQLGTKWYGFSPMKIEKDAGIRFADMFHGNDEHPGRRPALGYRGPRRRDPRALRVIRTLYLVILLAASCGGGGPRSAAPPPPAEPAPTRSAAGSDRAVLQKEADHMEELARQTCACADAACMQAVDDEVGAYYAVATMNDPREAVSLWPADIRDRLLAAQGLHYGCMAPAKVLPYSFAHLEVRRYSLYRAAMCACTDSACAQTLFTNLQSYVWHVPFAPRDAELAALQRNAEELQSCAARATAGAWAGDLAGYRAIRTRACECVDKTCAEQVAIESSAWIEANWWMPMTDQQHLDELAQLTTEFTQCVMERGADPRHAPHLDE